MLDFTPKPKTLVSLLPHQFHGLVSEQLLICDVQTDSREVAPGSLFIALKGLHDNGEKYIANAVENGAVAILVEDKHLASVLNVEVPIIGIENLSSCVADITEAFYDKPSQKLSLVGITGTNGKSTIASLVAQLCCLMGERAGIVGTLGYGLPNECLNDTGMTTPDVVKTQRILAEFVAQKIKTVAMEVSSHGIDQRRIENLSFEQAVLSNITRDHLDYHGTFEEYARVKKSFLLSEASEQAIFNLDDGEAPSLMQSLKAANKKAYTYSVENNHADVWAKIIGYTPLGINAEIHTPWGREIIFCPLFGKFNLSNVLAAITVMCARGRAFGEVAKLIAKLKPVDGRLQRVDIATEHDLPSVFIDYAHTPDALFQVIQALKAHVSGNLWLVFGCGGDRDRGKRAEMGKIAAEFADRVVVTSDNPRTESPQAIIDDIVAGFESKKVALEAISDRKLAISLAVGSCNDDDCVLIAGKGHEDYQLIGQRKIPFSDYHAAKEVLTCRRDSKGGRK